MYLVVANPSSLPNGWSIPTKFNLALINQIDSNETIKQEEEYTLNAQEIGFGSPEFIRLAEFHDSAAGYLVNDTCLIEAEVYVNDDSLASTDKAWNSSVTIDPVESVYVHANSFLRSLPKKPSTLVPIATPEVPKANPTFAKDIFDKLISYPLDALADPKHESALVESLSVLTSNLSFFSDVQAKEIMKLKATIPHIMQEWRDSIQVKESSLQLWITFEKTDILLQDLVEMEDRINYKD
ncbi:unnamed protein product [Cuscuta epithymum]|nr:unnamed protein product [Cuscuta epithymum]